MNYINHYRLGCSTVTHKGKNIKICNLINIASNLNSLERSQVDVGYIPAGYQHRPDLISNLFYGTVTKDWLILMFNNIRDPFQELNIGDRILLPKI